MGYWRDWRSDVCASDLFPLVEGTWPSWMPWVGCEEYLFFQYIFNLADTAISTGVGILIVFNKRIFSKPSVAETQ